jgi:hypothetical protein
MTFKERAEAAGVKVIHTEDLKTTTEKPYLYAMFTFLNRDSQEERAMAYPITRIELFRRLYEGGPKGQPSRIFVIGEDGEWKEQLR